MLPKASLLSLSFVTPLCAALFGIILKKTTHLYLRLCLSVGWLVGRLDMLKVRGDDVGGGGGDGGGSDGNGQNQ